MQATASHAAAVLVRELPKDDGVGERRLWQLHVRVAILLPVTDQAGVIPLSPKLLVPFNPFLQIPRSSSRRNIFEHRQVVLSRKC